MAELCRKNARLPVGCVIMASGLARRFGSNKLLADFGGRPLLCRALEVTATPALAARVVVTRSAGVKALCPVVPKPEPNPNPLSPAALRAVIPVVLPVVAVVRPAVPVVAVTQRPPSRRPPPSRTVRSGDGHQTGRNEGGNRH